MMGGGFTRGNPPAHWHSIDTSSDGLGPSVTGYTETAWPTVNLAIYVPVIVRSLVTVKKLWFANTTTSTGNFDIGLYDSTGTALLRKGSTAKTASDTEYVWDCTDTVLSPALYFLALASDSNTDTFLGPAYPAPLNAAFGVYTEASAFALPATATFAAPQTLAFQPLIGIFLNTLVS
jgi:hypothetical protein